MKGKIVTEKDVKDLLKFANRYMRTYSFLYPKSKLYYRLLIFLALTIIIIGGISCFLVYKKNPFCNELLIVTLVVCTITTILFDKYRKLELYRRPYTQGKRLKMLRRFYFYKGYNDFQLRCLISILEKKLSDNTNLNMSVILGILLLPIWENYVSYIYDKILMGVDINKIIISLFLRFIIILISIWCIAIINYIINYILSWRRRKIENIIYITQYIIHDKENDKR